MSIHPNPKPTPGVPKPRRALSRKRATPRRQRSPRCLVRGCKRIAQKADGIVDSWCKSHGNEERWKALSLEVRSLGFCELKGLDAVNCGGVLQAAHIFPKEAYPRIKFDRQNLLCICAGHHRYYTERWPGWREVVICLLGQTTFDELWSRSGA